MKAFIPTSVSRALFALVFGVFGLFHLMNANEMAGMVPIPGGAIWIYITGVAFILATISLIWGKMARTAAYLLGVMLAIFALSIWLPKTLDGDQTAMVALMKDIALAAAAFFMGNHSED